MLTSPGSASQVDQEGVELRRLLVKTNLLHYALLFEEIDIGSVRTLKARTVASLTSVGVTRVHAVRLLSEARKTWAPGGGATGEAAADAGGSERARERRDEARALGKDMSVAQSGGAPSSEAQWEMGLRDVYNDLLREAGVAPGARRLVKHLAAAHAAAPRYPRDQKDKDFHPWNNDGRQVAARVPLHRIELSGRHAGYNRIPVNGSMRPSHMQASAAYGNGYTTRNATMQHPGNGYRMSLHA